MGGHLGLVMAIDHEAVTAAWLRGDGVLEAARRTAASTFRTMTDALLSEAAHSGRSLAGTPCALSVRGTVQGDAIRLPGTNWTISRSGLRALFDRDPLVVNDVAACAWAAVGGVAGTPEWLARGSASSAPPTPGRRVLIWVDHGVGTAVIDVDRDGTARVLDGEMGHCAFAPATPEGARLAEALRASTGFAPSWEQVLTLEPDHLAWAAAGLPASRVDRAAISAALFGHMAGDAVMAHGAWSGVLMAGAGAARLLAGPGAAAFNAAFEARRPFTRLFIAAPRALLPRRDLIVQGGAVALAHALGRASLAS